MSSSIHLNYHFVFVTKYRHSVLAGIESDVRLAFEHAARGAKFEIVDLSMGAGDYVHLVVSLDPTVSVSQVINRLKQLTTLELWSKHEAKFKRKYWKKRLLWSSGYFASTVGEVSRKTVVDYVQRQAK